MHYESHARDSTKTDFICPSEPDMIGAGVTDMASCVDPWMSVKLDLRGQPLLR